MLRCTAKDSCTGGQSGGLANSSFLLGSAEVQAALAYPGQLLNQRKLKICSGYGCAGPFRLGCRFLKSSRQFPLSLTENLHMWSIIHCCQEDVENPV